MEYAITGGYQARPAHTQDACADACAVWSEYVSAHGGVTTSKEARRLHKIAGDIKNALYPFYKVVPERMTAQSLITAQRKVFRSVAHVSRPCCAPDCVATVSRIGAQMVGKNVFCSAACHNAFCAARHAARATVTLPCDCVGCNGTSHRLVMNVTPGKKYYCSTACQYEGRRQVCAAAKFAN